MAIIAKVHIVLNELAWVVQWFRKPGLWILSKLVGEIVPKTNEPDRKRHPAPTVLTTWRR